MREELYRPLGLELSESGAASDGRRLWVRLRYGVLGAGLLAASTATVLLQPDFRPPAPAPVQVASVAAPAAKAAPAAGPMILRPSESGGVTITDGDGVTRQGSELDGLQTGSVRVLEAGSLRQPAAFAYRPDDALVEPGAYGPLPKRAADGRRPLDVYAGAPAQTGGTRVAIVVGGLGISQTGTALIAAPQTDYAQAEYGLGELVMMRDAASTTGNAASATALEHLRQRTLDRRTRPHPAPLLLRRAAHDRFGKARRRQPHR